MTRPPRGLSPDEAALWARVAATVKPLERKVSTTPPTPSLSPEGVGNRAKAATIKPLPFRGGVGVGGVPKTIVTPPATLTRHGLDTSWERKLAKAALEPDFTLDLHGHGLDAAHARLEHGLALALAQGARLVLVIAGRARPAQAADRGSQRGAIRSKLLDWLAAGPHASKIAAVRPAHQRHGGAGAVYVVLRRPR